MQREINALLRKLEQPGDLGDAALYLGLVLEANAGVESGRSLVPGNLRDIELSEEEELAIVQRIIAVIDKRRDEERRQLFWVLSKASSRVLLVPLVTAIHRLSESFDEETATQALFALHRCLSDELLIAASATVLKECDIPGFLERMNTPGMSRRTNFIPRDLERLRQAING